MSLLKASDIPAMGTQYLFLSATTPISQNVMDEIAKAAATVVLGIISKAAYEWVASWKAKRKTRKSKRASNPHS